MNKVSENKSRLFEKISIDSVEETVTSTNKTNKPAKSGSKSHSNRPSKKKSDRNSAYEAMRIIPLGGLGEIGKNCTLFEYHNSSIVVDCGFSFPDNELYGVDYVIPDFSYIVDNRDKLEAILITHGHEDHIGALPYLLKQIHVPVYGTSLTIGLIEAKLEEHDLVGHVDLRTLKAGDTVNFKNFSVEAIRVNHSIPDAVAFAITTNVGTIVHTGDFKVDYTPVLGETIDLQRFSEIGARGVLALLADSTNAEESGSTMSESTVGKNLEALIPRALNKRIIIASFASNIQRIQQIIDIAAKHKRKVALCGRSMENYTRKAAELGYLHFPEGIIIELSEISRYSDKDLIIISTGSQGEPMSALSRMVTGTHKQISVTGNDFIIISASPIPGNEKDITRTINGLLKQGCEVIYESMYEVHASGHACQDDLKLMHRLINPKYFIPVHGEYKHLVRHADIAKGLGMPPENIIIADIGQVIEISDKSCKINGSVPSGRVLVDGLGVGDVGSVVLRDRKHLSQDGLIIVVSSIDFNSRDIISGPDIITRGFVYAKESEKLIDELRELARQTIENSVANRKNNATDLKVSLREAYSKYIYQKTQRSPMILPVIMEI